MSTSSARVPALLQHHPVFFERLGKIDGKRMEKEGASNELALSYHLREMEFMSQVTAY